MIFGTLACAPLSSLRDSGFVGNAYTEQRGAGDDVSGDAGRADSGRRCVPGDRGVCEPAGNVGAGVRAQRTGGDGATWRYDPRDLLKLYSVWLHEPATFVAAAGGGVPAQRGGDVAVGAAATGLQVDAPSSGGCTGRQWKRRGWSWCWLAREVGLVRGEWVGDRWLEVSGGEQRGASEGAGGGAALSGTRWSWPTRKKRW